MTSEKLREAAAYEEHLRALILKMDPEALDAWGESGLRLMVVGLLAAASLEPNLRAFYRRFYQMSRRLDQERFRELVAICQADDMPQFGKIIASDDPADQFMGYFIYEVVMESEIDLSIREEMAERGLTFEDFSALEDWCKSRGPLCEHPCFHARRG